MVDRGQATDVGLELIDPSLPPSQFGTIENSCSRRAHGLHRRRTRAGSLSATGADVSLAYERARLELYEARNNSRVIKHVRRIHGEANEAAQTTTRDD